MKYLLLLILSVSSLCVDTPEASARDCYGCYCTYECHRDGTCKKVCRDSCGQFC